MPVQQLAQFAYFCLYYLLRSMDSNTKTTRNIKTNPLILSVLNIPCKSDLKEQKSPSTQFSLWQWASKKSTLASHKLNIPKSKLLSNLQIYEWRHQTQFPIVRTSFVCVKQNQISFSQVVELSAYVEYCPIKLKQIYEMTLGQALYIFKQALIGFQRLYNRFGTFEVMSSMIAINDKGSCRVWLNQNFGLNSPVKKDVTEKNMVSKIVTIIQSHSQQSRASKKIFAQLLECDSFLKALRAVQKIVKDSKLFLPTKFVSVSSPQDAKKNQHTPNKQMPSLESIPSAPTRLSVKYERLSNARESIREYLKISPKKKKDSLSPLQFRRIKTDYAIGEATAAMKASDETAYTSGVRNKTSHTDFMIGSWKDGSHSSGTKATELMAPKKLERELWHNIDMEQSLKKQQIERAEREKCKKQLSHSQLYSKNKSMSPQKRKQQRKYSFKLQTQVKKDNSPSKYLYFTKKSVQQPYFSQFQNLLNHDNNSNNRPFEQIMEEDDDRTIEQVKGNVIKKNGWIENVSNLAAITNKMEESFHQGVEENHCRKDIKLHKLDKIGKETQRSLICDDFLGDQVYI